MTQATTQLKHDEIEIKTESLPIKEPAPESPMAQVQPAQYHSVGKGMEQHKKTRSEPRRGHELYLNRELTWLNFNLRVLCEAEDPRTPLLERVKFTAIVCSNMDEFFMKRIGGLKQQVGAGVMTLSLDGRTPQEQISDCHKMIAQIESRKRACFHMALSALSREGVEIQEYSQLSKTDIAYLRKEFYRNIFPLVTPQGIDPAHPFPFISNLSLNLLVRLRQPGEGEGEVSLARVKVPVGYDVPRFLRIRDSYRFVRLEDVISNNLDMLFPKMEIISADTFRVTRNAVTEMDEEQADDLLEMIETELRYRQFASVVRLQVNGGMDPVLRGMLAAEMGLDELTDVFEVEGVMGKSSLFEIAGLDIPKLHDPPHVAIDHPRLKDKRKIFYKLREDGPILLVHPYESFSTSVERFLQEASEDPKVRAIKMTLYRTSRDSKVIRYLVNAARNGKQVAVVVELKARFDEAANIQWANRLEEAGIHVTYGVVGYKTHSKVILVVRRDYDGLRRYAHFSTGNYHAVTARMYTDFGLFTCDPIIGEDLTEYFNYLSTGYTPKRNYKKLLVAPSYMKEVLLKKIQREIDNKKRGKDSLIQIKTNAFQDVDMINALYRASKAGVKVNLLVRDTCCLRPGLKGVSENIRVVSIVGRFLEHSRVYHFLNDGEDEFFIGSADCMTRNLEHRVETLVPVEDVMLCTDIRRILEIQLEDERSAWDMKSDGTYVQRTPKNALSIGSQENFIDIAGKRQRAAGQLKRLKSRGKSKKEYWHAY